MKKQNIVYISIFIFVILLFLISLIVFATSSKNEYHKAHISLKYDSSWIPEILSDDMLILKHQTGSLVEVVSTPLDDINRYYSTIKFSDQLRYKATLQNENYVLINEESLKVSENGYDGYRMLFEDGKNQMLIYAIKNEEYLVIVDFIASNDYFDILLDSVLSIIYTIKIK